MIQNPIIPGFNPDPSILRVADDYFITTSSFEWLPGIPIYHSRDLVHWELIDYALKSDETESMVGIAPSKGVWAPCLSYCYQEKRFYLVYSIVHSSNVWMFDVDNYLIWSEDIHGPWSKALYVNSSGFDPSLFHDDDGKKWVINKDRDFRPENMLNRSIVLQQYSVAKEKLLGNPVSISHGATQRGFVEGAHIYKHNSWYYLMTAEGGTGYGHCVALSRAKCVTGPYESCPHNPIITSSLGDHQLQEAPDFMLEHLYNPDVPMQKAGHGSLVETQNGEWYVAHLCARPVMPQKRCVLGRETAIQKVEWTEDGWLRLWDGSQLAKQQVPAPELPSHPFPKQPSRFDFEEDTLDMHLCAPRNLISSDWVDIVTRKSFLRLRGRESLTSNFYPSILARRLTSFTAKITTRVMFEPDNYHHLAGLVCYYDSANYYCIYKTYHEKYQGCILTISGFINARMIECGSHIVPIKSKEPVSLRAEISGANLQFSYCLQQEAFEQLGPVLDITTLSDEASRFGRFTGTFVGMFAQDSHTREKWAEFDYFEYSADTYE